MDADVFRESGSGAVPPGVSPPAGPPGPPVSPAAGPPAAADRCPTCGAAALPSQPQLPPPMDAALGNTAALSPRERAAFRLLGLGYDNRAIARELNLSERTVKRHVSAVLAKLGVESRLQAGLVALLVGAEAAG